MTVLDPVAEHPGERTLRRAGMATAWWAAQRPDGSAVLSEHGDRTNAELNAKANRLARALRARGLVTGDAVALMARNRPEWVETYAACLRAGWRLTPVNWHLTADEAAYIVDDCEAKALLLDAHLPAVASGLARPSRLLASVAVGGDLGGHEPYAAFIEGFDGADIEDPSPGTTMLYTSGTTGRPKGVHREPASSVRAVDRSGHRADDVYLCTGPMYHGGPLAVTLHPPLQLGTPIVVMDGWEAEESLRLIERHRVTHTHMVPTMFHQLLALPDAVRHRYDLSSLRAVWHGAAPCPVHVKKRIIEWLGPVVYEYYSATEGLGCVVDSATWLEHPGTVGRPEPLDQVIVGDEDGRPLPVGQIGLLWIKAPERYRFDYFKDDGKTAGAYRDTHFTLGDMGYKDADDYLYLTDRSAELIISGGVNIYPAEIDAVLLAHPAVADAATIGVPDDEWGERVLAVVEPTVGANRTGLAEEPIAHCRDHLAAFKCPRRVDLVDALPRTDAGKVYKRHLREEYRARRV